MSAMQHRQAFFYCLIVTVLHPKQGHFAHWGCNWHNPSAPWSFQVSSFPGVKKHTMQDVWPRLNQRGLWALCRGIQEVSECVYSWMCCSASDSNHASVIKAEGMSSLWTLPNHNPLAWRGVGRGEERRGWKDGLKVQYTETDVWHLAGLFGLIWPSLILLVYYKWHISVPSHYCCLLSPRHEFNLNNVCKVSRNLKINVFQSRGNDKGSRRPCYALVIIKVQEYNFFCPNYNKIKA